MIKRNVMSLCTAICLLLMGTVSYSQTDTIQTEADRVSVNDRSQADEPTAESSAIDGVPATLSLFVFVDTVPVKGTRILLNGRQLGVTNDNGRVTGQIPLGEQVITVDSTDHGRLERTILFTDGEAIQLLVNFFTNGMSPFVDIETSNPNKAIASAAPVVEDTQEPGFLEGVITNANDGQPIVGVRVFVSGTAQEVTTDDAGTFRFILQPGEYALSVLASRFNTRTLEGIPITTEETTSQDIQLTPAGSELPEFVVIEPFVAGSLASVLEERREEASVADYLGAEQISRNGDGDVASALRRVTGLTLIGGRFVFIRGLGERYSATLLNGADIPSPDPTRRVVPLDLFPTSIVESIEVQKGFTPDSVADFGGGVVQIKTRSIPEENFFRVALSGQYNAQATFQDGLRSDRGGSDIFGFDDGLRGLPEEIAEPVAEGNFFNGFNINGFQFGIPPEEFEALTELLPVNYNIDPTSLPPGFGVDLSGGMRFDLGIVKLGFVSAVSWSNDWENTSQIRRTFALSSTSDSGLEAADDFVFDNTQRSIDLSGFNSVGLELGEYNHLTFNQIWLRNTTDENEFQNGFSQEFGTQVMIGEIEFEERELQTYQFAGDHVIPFWNFSTFDWQYTLAESRSDIPDFRSYQFEQDFATGVFAFSELAEENSRDFSELDDSGASFNLNFSANIGDIDGDNHATFKIGYSDVSRDRASQVLRFQFARGTPSANPLAFTPGLLENLPDDILNPEFIDPMGFIIDNVTTPSDTYTADLSIESLYYGIDLTLFGFLRLYGGFRDESFTQLVSTFDPLSPASAVESLLDTDDLLPGFTLTASLPWETEFRFGYSRTVNRPQFRELTPSFFVDPILDSIAVGNVDLIPADITNFDFRIDKYFSDLEFASFSFFIKDFVNPIEQQILAGSTGFITFGNVPSAQNTGFEFEFYKDLSFIGNRVWSDMYLSANFAFINSSVDIDFGVDTILTSSERALQGQSPIVINAQVGYFNPDNGISSTVLFNVAGERIIQVGTFDRPDIFEQPFNQLDWVTRYTLDNWVFRLNVRNLLNDEVEFTQGSEVSRLFTRGREVSFGIQYTFN